MKIFYLSDTWPWFGTHQCYGRLAHYVKEVHPETKIVSTKYNLTNRFIGKLYSFCEGWPWRKDTVFAAAEAMFSSFFRKSVEKEGIYHILFFDNHFLLMKNWEKAPKNLITTIHHPIGRKYPPLMEENLRKLSSAIVMYSEGAEYFEKYVGKGRVKFIHYGVDTDFFYPAEKQITKNKRLFFTGQNGRNIPMLKRVISKLARCHMDLKFDFLVPEKIKHESELKELIGHPNIKWHKGLTEREVRNLYQKSYLLLMPINDSGVNTAVVEALACGLPIVTTDVGGIRDYGGESIYPIVKNNDDDAMINLAGKYLLEQSWRDEVAKKCYKFAEQNLSWPIIANKHMEAYRELAGLK